MATTIKLSRPFAKRSNKELHELCDEHSIKFLHRSTKKDLVRLLKEHMKDCDCRGINKFGRTKHESKEFWERQQFLIRKLEEWKEAGKPDDPEFHRYDLEHRIRGLQFVMQARGIPLRPDGDDDDPGDDDDDHDSDDNSDDRDHNSNGDDDERDYLDLDEDQLIEECQKRLLHPALWRGKVDNIR